MDDTYQVYVNRLAGMMSRDAYYGQAQNIQSSSKYELTGSGRWQAVSFPGYTVMTPIWQDAPANTNQAVYQRLQDYQTRLVKAFPPNLLVPVPAESFHVTIADLIWDDAYRHASQDANFTTEIQERIADSFLKSQTLRSAEPVEWQILGLILMPRAIAVGLVPKNEASYNRICSLRRQIYQNPELVALGIEQQYHFTAHITLGYFADVDGAKAFWSENGAASLTGEEGKPSPFAAEMSQILSQFNDEWLNPDDPAVMIINHARLYQFDSMTQYHHPPDWPSFAFMQEV